MGVSSTLVVNKEGNVCIPSSDGREIFNRIFNQCFGYKHYSKDVGGVAMVELEWLMKRQEIFRLGPLFEPHGSLDLPSLWLGKAETL